MIVKMRYSIAPSRSFLPINRIRYNQKYSTIDGDSGLLHHSRPSENRKSIDKTYKELIQRKVLLNVTEEQERRGRKIVDVLYILWPHMDFVSEVKAANARQRDHQKELAKPRE